MNYQVTKVCNCRSLWPHNLRRKFAAARLLRLLFRIPLRAWMYVCCDCCVLSGRGLCDGMITRPEESYRLWCVVVCGLETSCMSRPWPNGGCCARKKSLQLLVTADTLFRPCTVWTPFLLIWFDFPSR